MRKICVFLLFFMCLFVTGCGNNKEKVVATLDEFNTVLSENNFTVNNNTAYYTRDVGYIIGARLALYDNDLQIEMIEYKDNEIAQKVQDSQIDSFALLKSTGAHESVDKGKNYYKYILISNNRYMVNVRVDNTLIFCKTLLENKETVENILETLGY